MAHHSSARCLPWGFLLQFLTPIIGGIADSIILALLLDMLVVYATRQLSNWQPQRG
ncbi:hypothetical protein PAG80_24855 [Klebsiella quasipneumoniae]|nr:MULTISPECIES: hypothetical protein [Klebsiella]MCS6055376.1 hypothetical protein [Klebsiella variicola subsp. variicola]MDR4699041.1 hypothetical protein [Klebsiella quasipneumoniae]MCF2748054.1 hypothetical protein [Klebsiella pneumoniae]MCL0515668.1 hypothetical protein [Klebsiella pneumoniae]MCM2386450.1 hypothetical protein [Klebsiella pneumoniae]